MHYVTGKGCKFNAENVARGMLGGVAESCTLIGWPHINRVLEFVLQPHAGCQDFAEGVAKGTLGGVAAGCTLRAGPIYGGENVLCNRI